MQRRRHSAPSTVSNFSNITFIVAVPFTVTCTSGPPASSTVFITTTVTLYNPSGTTPSCTVLSGACSCVLLPTGPWNGKASEQAWQSRCAYCFRSPPQFSFWFPRMGSALPRRARRDRFCRVLQVRCFHHNWDRKRSVGSGPCGFIRRALYIIWKRGLAFDLGGAGIRPAVVELGSRLREPLSLSPE